MSEPLLVDVNEARRLLGGVSRNTMFRLMRDEGLPHVKIGARLLFAPDQLRTWIEAHTVGRKEAA
jgi:excisionase family DNA binding protein